MGLFNSQGIPLKNRRSSAWVEDSFVRHASPLENPHEYVATSLSKPVYLAVWTGVFFVIAALGSRVAYLQTFKEHDYQVRAESNRSRHIPIPAERGILYDRFGTPLVQNIPRFSLHVLPFDLPKKEDDLAGLASVVATTLATPYDETLAKLKEAAATPQREVALYDDITNEQAIALSVRASTLPALQIVSGIKREYRPPGTTIDMESLSHIIGYEGKITKEEYEAHVANHYQPTDYIGKQGIEAGYETLLRGTKGDKAIEVDAAGVGLGTLSEVAPIAGTDLELSIDRDLQTVAEHSLKESLRVNSKDRGAVVVEDIHTGELLALVSIPGYDNNAFAHGVSHDQFAAIINDPRHPLIPRAVAGQYPSGSIIKPVYALAGLQEGVITPETTVNSVGGIHVGQWFFPDWKAGGHGVVNVKDAIAMSVNTFFYILGGGYEDRVGLGVDRLRTWLTTFGFGQKTGIAIPAEQDGFIPSPDWKKSRKGEPWYIGDTYNLSIGQGDFLITPLQVANAITAIANGGDRFVPHLVHAEKTPTSGDWHVVAPEIASRISADPANFQVVREGMRQAVTAGSARSLQTIPIDVAGKTGTAQSVGGKLPHAWFVGFAPYEHPDIAITVLVEEGGEGSSVSVPVAHAIFDWWAKVGAERYHGG